MKAIVILGDGMADHPIPELGGRTPLMAAKKPAMDQIAREGRTGLFRTIQADMPTGSAVANLAVLGYDPRATFSGRGVLEAASLGIHVAQDDLVMRVNLITIENGKIKSHSSGHITNGEAFPLIDDLHESFSPWGIALHQGLSYRHVLVMPRGHTDIECSPPHDHIGEEADALMIRPLSDAAVETALLLNRMIIESRKRLENHPVNIKRRAEGKLPANSLWPWSPGKKPRMEFFEERFGVKGAVISAVDLIKGLAVYAGMDVISVEGATGLYDTNYEGKADACLAALKNHDFVYVHVEAPDEAGHDRNLNLKIQCIEDLDRRLVQRILDGLEKRKIEAVVAVLPDHPTPVALGKHARDPVPVAIRDPGMTPDAVTTFDEESVKKGGLGLLEGAGFMNAVFRSAR
jgi:2,3-bisphosphoglycerate-independent phosphoglycerate mutase